MQKRLTLLLAAALAATSLSAQLTSVEEVYTIFQDKCVACHDHASPEANLDLEGSGATAQARALNVASHLVNIAPENTYAQGQGYKRISPGRPDRSFLFRKINSGFEPTIAALHADEDSPMPSYPGTPLTELEKEVIRQWILFGAKNIGVLFDKAVLEDFYAGNGEKSFPDGPPPAPAPGEGFQLKMGPFYLAPDAEVEYYQKYALNLLADVEVNRVDFLISNYSHHFLLYHFDSPAAAAGFPDGFRLDANHSNIGLTAAVQEATNIELPPTTAFKWAKDKVFDFNSHYINYSLNRPYQCEAYLNVYTQPPGTAAQEMNTTLLIKEDIYIPNNGSNITQTDAEYQFGAGNVYIWGLMGHTHKYGTGYKVWKRLSNGQKGELIYDAGCPGGQPGCSTPLYDYKHIPLRYWLPLLPVNWSNGIVHEATWVNDGPESVWFGPTSDDEMMVLIAFYTLQPVVVGTEEPGAEAMLPLLVMPNPASGRVSVATPGTKGIKQLKLFDLAGRELMRRSDFEDNTVELEIGDLAPGIYWLNADGHVGKLVVGK